MRIVNSKYVKMCWAKPGDVVRLIGADLQVDPAMYLVCAVGDGIKGKRAARELASNGMYDDQRPLFLVNIETGILMNMTHLSGRVDIIRDVAVVEGLFGEQSGNEVGAA
jgi:hypothetical protein